MGGSKRGDGVLRAWDIPPAACGWNGTADGSEWSRGLEGAGDGAGEGAGEGEGADCSKATGADACLRMDLRRC